MKTKIAATLLALTFAAGIGFPAAADEGSAFTVAPAAQSRAVAPAPPVQSGTLATDKFMILADVGADALSPDDMAMTRGAASFTTARYSRDGECGKVCVDVTILVLSAMVDPVGTAISCLKGSCL